MVEYCKEILNIGINRHFKFRHKSFIIKIMNLVNNEDENFNAKGN
jgi:hypothetical protein